MSTRELFATRGSILLFIGVFLPILSIPIVGSVNYFQNGRGDGVIILVLAVLSCVFAHDYKKLWFTGLGSLAVMLFTFINFHLKMAETKAGMESSLAENPFRGLADLAIQSVQLQWGWAILLLGAALVIVAAAMKEEGGAEQDAMKSKKCPFCAEIIKAEAILCKHCGRDQPTPVIISSTGGTAQWEDCHEFERASSIKLRSRVLQFEKNYAFALYLVFCSVLVLLFLGTFHIYYGGDVGLQIIPKTRFGYEDTIVDVDKIRP